jgi:phosphate transport system protein
MSVHLQREIEKLKKLLLSLCSLVEDQVQLAMRSYLTRDEKIAVMVEKQDCVIDRREVEVEEECLKILALHQPVAIDLRMIVGVMKINNDLERIGDLAVNISHKAIASAAEIPLEIQVDIDGMAEKTRIMLFDAINAMINMDAGSAKSVSRRDDEIDLLKADIRSNVEMRLRDEPENMRSLLLLLGVARNLERIADCATSIAEDVIYMIEGRIVRHEHKFQETTPEEANNPAVYRIPR